MLEYVEIQLQIRIYLLNTSLEETTETDEKISLVKIEFEKGRALESILSTFYAWVLYKILAPKITNLKHKSKSCMICFSTKKVHVKC